MAAGLNLAAPSENTGPTRINDYIVLMVRGLLRWRHMKRPFLEPDVTTGRCSLSDLDHMMHMNNVKYLRAFEFGRAAFGLKNRLWHKARDLRAHLLISAQVVRYRRPVTLFQAFEIHSKASSLLLTLSFSSAHY
ncbi:hypothetical protein MTO96_027621 [Rhipicephalus appendiculatus]